MSPIHLPQNAFRRIGIALLWITLSWPAWSQTQLPLTLKVKGRPGGLEISWPAIQKSETSPIDTFIEVSADLVHWDWLQDTSAAELSADGKEAALVIPFAPGNLFVRVASESASTVVLAQNGEEMFGFGPLFYERLEEIGWLEIDQFKSRFPEPDYLTDLPDWDPKNAEFWDELNLDPNTITDFNIRQWRKDLRLNPGEIEGLNRNGFVVTDRISSNSFAEAFYRIFVADLPVYVSADSILHAWHMSFGAMLKELEAAILYPEFTDLIDTMILELGPVWAELEGSEWKDSVLDVDFFLGVAQRLLHEGLEDPAPSDTPLGQIDEVQDFMTRIRAEKLEEVNLFGRAELQKNGTLMDFSQFKPRGHYTMSPEFEAYFKALMWLGRIDFRIAGDPDLASPRELGAVVILHELLIRSGQLGRWQNLDNIIRVLVGESDYMNFSQFDAYLNLSGLSEITAFQSLEDLNPLRTLIERSNVGTQEILTHAYYIPLGTERFVPPQSFAFFGQRFVMDSWAMGKLVFDQILWDNQKVLRGVPSGVDVAFSVFANDAAVPVVADRIMNQSGRPARDGVPYQHNLTAIRNTLDAMEPAAWEGTIYNHWLGALRTLSKPLTDSSYPAFMRTRAWGRKTLNTQLASWTQLRHDTVLLAKQSVTPPLICEYPRGYVDPVPDFFLKLAGMTSNAAKAIANLGLQGNYNVLLRGEFGGATRLTGNRAQLSTNQVGFLNRFSETMIKLADVAEKIKNRQPLSNEQTAYFNNLLEQSTRNLGCAGILTYSGWYPGLFYQNIFVKNDPFANHPSNEWDPVVTDVHTNIPSDWDPGSILHEGVGNINMAVLLSDFDECLVVYCGPVMSYYEFETKPNERITDETWKFNLGMNPPPVPEWTGDYLFSKRLGFERPPVTQRYWTPPFR